MLRLYLREVAAAGMVVAILVALGLLYRWVYKKPPQQAQAVRARIVGFDGYLTRGQFRNVTVGSVALPDGQIARVPWPDRRARHCRKGDYVDLARYGPRFKVVGDGCKRS